MSINFVGSSDLEIAQITQVTPGANYIVGFDVALSQTEVPYIVPSTGTLPDSETGLYVYGDTVTITGDLLNPGRTIAIYARQIVANPNTFINVTGGAAASDYAPGQPALPSNPQPGETGPTGGNGSTGLTAGSVILMTGNLVVDGADSGAGTPTRTACQMQLLNHAIAAAIASYNTSAPASTSLSNWSKTWDPGNLTGTLTLSGITLGAMKAKLTTPVALNSSGECELTITLGTPSFNSAYAINYTNEPSQNLSGGCNGSFSAQVAITVKVGPTPAQLTIVSQEIDISSLTVNTGHVTVNVSVHDNTSWYLKSSLAKIPAAIAAAIQANYLPNQSQSGSTPSLILLANGGIGGRGQDGGAGIQGQAGTPGTSIPQSDPIPYGASTPPETLGGNGSQGGTGGNAGTSGTGGAGGSIQVGIAAQAFPCIGWNAQGGPGGAAASAGAPGAGGTLGPGGTFYIDVGEGHTQVMVGPNGNPGPPGDPATFQGAPGSSGANGTASVAGSGDVYAAVAAASPLQQLTLLQQGATLTYLNAQATADYQALLAVYTWLQNISASANQPSTLNGNDAATRLQIYQATQLELARLSAGLDYFGNPCNWAPVLSWQWLQTRINQQIDLYQAIQQAIQQSSTPSNQAQQTADQIQGDIQNLSDQITDLASQQLQLSGNILALTQQISIQRAKFTADTTSAQQAYTISLANPQCTFNDVLNGLSSLVQLASSSFADVSDLTKTLGIEQSGTSLFGQVANLVLGIATSSADVPSVANAWNGIQSTLSQYGPNSALVAVDVEQFDQTIQNWNPPGYTDILEDDVTTLIGLIQTRNQALLNFTSIYTQWLRVKTQLSQKTAELEYMAQVLAGQADPQMPAYLAFVQSSLNEIALSTATNLYQANQAFNYWAVASDLFTLDGLDIVSLSDAATKLTDGVQDYLEGTAAPFSKFNSIYYLVTPQTNPSAFVSLQKNQILPLQFADSAGNPFAGAYNVTADTISIALPGVTPPAGSLENPTILHLTITQSGPDLRDDGSGNTLSFTHLPRSILYEYNYTTGVVTVTGTIGDETQGSNVVSFNGLSPFALWTIDFSDSNNAWLDLSTLDQVQVSFTGTLVGTTKQLSAKA